MKTILLFLMLTAPLATAEVAPLPIVFTDSPEDVTITATCLEVCLALSPWHPLPGDCQVHPGLGGGIRCDQEGPCGMLTEATCWTLRFLCYYTEGPMQGLLGQECETQPGCCAQEEAGSCNNYGVQVVVSVGSSVCEGEACANHGIQVIVGEYCDQENRVCAGSFCLEPCSPVTRMWDASEVTISPTSPTPTTVPVTSKPPELCL